MSSLTKEEMAWIKKVEQVLAACPKRFGFYCIGDSDIGIFDKTKEHLFDEGDEFVSAVYNNDADLGQINFPSQVHAVRG